MLNASLCMLNASLCMLKKTKDRSLSQIMENRYDKSSMVCKAMLNQKTRADVRRLGAYHKYCCVLN